MALVDDTKEKLVLMISENLCNIGREFANLDDLHTIQSDAVSSTVAAALCASHIIGHQHVERDEETPHPQIDIIMVMVTAESESIRDVIADLVHCAPSARVVHYHVCELNDIDDDFVCESDEDGANIHVL